MTKAVSLSAELAEVRSAVEGARFIADALAARGFDNRQRELQAPVAVTAILVLAELRLQQVERVLRGEEDPLTLWAPHNDSPPASEEGEQDVVLRPWNQHREDKGRPAQKKTGRSRPTRRSRQPRPPATASPAHPEGGGEHSPSTEEKS